MREPDPLVAVIEDRRLDGPLEELVGVPAEELVERVLAGDVHRDPLAPAPGPAPHLAQAGDGAREGGADRGVELADVDPELERVGGDHREQLARREPRLDLAALLRRVAGPVGRDPVGELAVTLVLEAHLCEALDQLDPAAAAQEADRPHAGGDEVGEQLGRLRERRAPRPEVLVDQRRVPDPDPPPGPRRAVRVDQGERLPDEPLGELDRVRDRRRGEDEPRVRAVDSRDAAQPPHDVGDVGAEDAAVGVGLVEDDPLEVGEHVSPALVVGQDADVEHVRVGQDQVRALADLRPVLARRVAVVDRVAQRAEAELGELSRLVLGERLGRIEVDRTPGGIAGQRVENGQVEGERLAGGRAAGDDQVALGGGLERLELVREEALDAGAAQGRDELGMERVGDLRRLGQARRQRARLDQAAVVDAGSDDPLPGGLDRGARRLVSHGRSGRRPEPRRARSRRGGAAPGRRP